MRCSRCASDDISIQAVAQKQKKGLLQDYALDTFGYLHLWIVLLIPIIMNKGSKTVTYAVCQNCGNSWEVQS